jgi:hypothetical protein
MVSGHHGDDFASIDSWSFMQHSFRPIPSDPV